MKILLLTLFSLLTLTISPMLGRDIISFSDIVNSNLENYLIFWKLRLPNSLLAFMTGGLLSIAGLLFQSLFRNALASPYTLGIASGASFGAVLALALGIELNLFFLSGITLFSFIGALLSIGVIYFIANFNKQFDPYRILLAGISVGLLFSSFILLIQFLSLGTNVNQMIHWLMGNISTVGFNSHIRILPFLLMIVSMAIYYSKEIDLIKFHNDFSISRGINVNRVKKIMFIVTSLSIAAVVSEVGPIGFVGLLIPHASKLLFGHKGRTAIFATVLLGGSFLTLCELLSRTILEQSIIPMGIITALVGTPFFIVLLSTKKISS